MKRNLFFVTASVLALSATAAMAGDNEAFVSQSGTSQDAAVTQSNSGNKVGTFNNNSGFIQEDGAAPSTGNNQLSIVQDGSGNWVGKNKQGKQSGSDNNADIIQHGTNSTVELSQTGQSNGILNPGWTNATTGNRILQDATATSSTVDLTQTGKNNAIDIAQGGSGNRTTASQIGTNQLYVRQSTAETDTNTPAVYGAFAGTNGAIDVNQTSTAENNYAAVAQGGGNGNRIKITQDGATLAAGVNQNGNRNYFSSTQTGTGNLVGIRGGFYSPAGADDPIKQTGDYNTYINTQGGSDSVALGSQTGKFNGVVNNQIGTSNSIFGTQNGTGNGVFTSQSGKNNSLTYNQGTASVDGTGNFINNNQSGISGDAVIHQYGSFNVAYNVQIGTDSTLKASSDGVGNYIYNNQDGANSSDVYQKGSGNRSVGYQLGGSGNQATVNQTGDKNRSYYKQDGSSNTVNITQTSNGNNAHVTQLSSTGSVATINQH